MLVQDLVCALNLTVKVMTKEGGLRTVEGGYCGDVLSHVMANAGAGCVWVTVQTHENVIAVASLLDVACVLVCQREIAPETCERAEKEGVTLLWSEDDVFRLVGRLHSLTGRK